MRDLAADLRFAARQLIKHPIYSASVLLSLALGIGVNTTVFTVANAILFRAPQAAHPGDLVRIYVNHHSPFTWADYRRIKQESRVFSHVIAEVVQPVSLTAGGEPEQAFAALGAPTTAILRTILGETLRTVLIGGIVGLGLALAVGRLVSSQLYGVGALDPVTFIGTPILLLLIAAAATLVPARRAVAVDPVVALREG